MTTTNTPAVDPDERVVAVHEIVEGTETVFYAIRDTNLGYWRSVRPIDDDYAAWTRDRHLRAEFATRDEAEYEMASIWKSRRKSRQKSLRGAA